MKSEVKIQPNSTDLASTINKSRYLVCIRFMNCNTDHYDALQPP